MPGVKGKYLISYKLSDGTKHKLILKQTWTKKKSENLLSYMEHLQMLM